ncbi:MAG: hypothetical protein ACLSUW_07225 [Akkermansia sp.]
MRRYINYNRDLRPNWRGEESRDLLKTALCEVTGAGGNHYRKLESTLESIPAIPSALAENVEVCS